ncbi:MAG: hypothetical protein ACOCXZ_00370 [Chloroflexota bacterium]
MPVDVRFADDNRYIVYTFQEPLEMAELLKAYEEERRLRDSVDHVVNSIVDMSEIRRIPRNWLTAKAGPGLTHPRSGAMLFVGISPGLHIILNTIMKVARYNKMQFFKTRAEAEAHMAEILAAQTVERA